MKYSLSLTNIPDFCTCEIIGVCTYEIIGVEIINNKRVYRIIAKELSSNEYRPRKDTK